FSPTSAAPQTLHRSAVWLPGPSPHANDTLAPGCTNHSTLPPSLPPGRSPEIPPAAFPLPETSPDPIQSPPTQAAPTAQRHGPPLFRDSDSHPHLSPVIYSRFGIRPPLVTRPIHKHRL